MRWLSTWPSSAPAAGRTCARLPGLAVVVCTGPASVAQRVRGLRLGADVWMTKPCHPEELIAVVEAAVRRHRRNEMPELESPTRFAPAAEDPARSTTRS